MPFSQIIPPFPSPTESKSLFYTSLSLLLSHIQGYHYHLSKFHVYVLVYCIGLAALGLHCCTQTFSSCGKGKRELCFVAVCRLLTVASLVVEHRLCSVGSVVVMHGLNCHPPPFVGSSWTKD